MADYNNLKTLQGLAVGDVITYDTTTSINFARAKVKVELYGRRDEYSSSYYGNGGKASFVIDTSLLPINILTFNNDGTSAKDTRNDLIFSISDSLYYRIAVAGNSGKCQASSVTVTPGKGGGSTGGKGSGSSYGSGGGQTYGGSGSTQAEAGVFGNGGAGYGSYGTEGGYGWYGGGGGGYYSAGSYTSGGGGGGSGFIIGVSTTTYPDGYLDNNTELQTQIASAITEGVLTQGGSTETTPKMVLTIVEKGFEPEGEILGISIYPYSTYQTIFAPDNFSSQGLILDATFINGTTQIMEGFEVIPPGLSTLGIKTVQINYTYNGKKVSTSYEIEIKNISYLIEPESISNLKGMYGLFVDEGKKGKFICASSSGTYSTGSGLYTYDFSDPSNINSITTGTFYNKEGICRYKDLIFAFQQISGGSSILCSKDFGTTWSENISTGAVTTTNSNYLNFIFFEVKEKLFFFFHDGSTKNVLYKFNENDETWSIVGTYTCGRIFGSLAVDNNNAIVVISELADSSGKTQIIYTRDGGETWNITNLSSSSGSWYTYILTIRGDVNILRIGYSSYTYYKTTNGGQSYSSITDPTGDFSLTRGEYFSIGNFSDYEEFLAFGSSYYDYGKNTYYIPSRALYTSTNGSSWTALYKSEATSPKIIGKKGEKYVVLKWNEDLETVRVALVDNILSIKEEEYISELNIPSSFQYAKYDGRKILLATSTSSSTRKIIQIDSFVPEGSILGLEISGMKTEFNVEDNFYFGGRIKGIWSNGSKVIRDGYTISSPDMNKEGEKKVTISYTDENGTTVSISYVITVHPIILFEYTGLAQEKILKPGKYKLQVWGAQGGSYNSSYQGGYGGYSEGIITINENTPIFVYVGGQPSAYEGGFNGGGAGKSQKSAYAKGGGGGTDIRIGTDSLYARVIVAGGGGGCYYYSSSYNFNSKTTNYGGGEESGANSSSYKATQTSGYTFGEGQGTTSSSPSSSAVSFAPGAGGGWYGGKRVTSSTSSSGSSSYYKANGGGSGYVYTETTAVNYPSGCLLNETYYLTEAKTIAGNQSIPTHDNTSTMTGNTGNGFVVITKVGDVESGETTSVFYYYAISEFIPTNPYYYNGSEFVLCDAYRHNGTEFVKIE